MKAVLQRVTKASVEIFETVGDAVPHTTREIGRGYAVLLGVAQGDSPAEADRLVDKMAGLRVFADQDGKMNLDIRQAGGAFLVVSQFTLLADTRKGRRPSFIRAADPESGEALYHYVVKRLREEGFTVATGEFGAHMLVNISNDGPVTILLDTAEM
ncbi:MAG: dtd [Chloroflexi bacterium]|nr:dtd [Chloroflexota bacterium]MDB5074791.1 dtd [Chloroflexota bacterium]